MNKWSENFRGAALMSASMAGFVLNDTLMKMGAADLGLFQAMFLRGIFSTLFLTVYAWHKRALFIAVPRADWKILIWRSIGEIGCTLCFLTALFNMPLANATAILQVLPLGITLGAAVFLGEAVGWRRYMAVIVGFGGVLVIVRPGAEGFNAYSFLAIAAVGFIVLRDLVTFRLSSKVPSAFVALLAAATIMTAGGVLAPSAEWRPVGMGQIVLMAGAASFLIFGYLFAIMAMRVGQISFVSPFRYTSLIWAIALGIIVFSDIPDVWTLTGSAIIIVMGIYTFHRERMRSKVEHAAQGKFEKEQA